MTVVPTALHPAIRVRPVIRPELRAICLSPSPGCPRGCPNWGRQAVCPPQAQLLPDVIDITQPVYCIYDRIDLTGAHELCREMDSHEPALHLRCRLYFSSQTARGIHGKVQAFLAENPGLTAVYVPEACGVDISATLRQVGGQLEWPPERYICQVALVGTPTQ